MDQPSLRQRLADPDTAWAPLTVRWYGGCCKVLECATGTALQYCSGQPVVPFRWVLLQDPDGVRVPMTLLCTDPQRNRPAPDRGLVPAPLAGGGRVPGRAHPVGRGDSAPVVGPRHRPHHPRFAGPLQLGHRDRPRPAAGTALDPLHLDALALVRIILWAGAPPFVPVPTAPQPGKPPPLDPKHF